MKPEEMHILICGTERRKYNMGMGIGINAGLPDAGEIKGFQEPIACGAWFTSTGRILPKTIKFQDEEGVLHTLSDIHVIHSEEKFYCGIPTMEFECDIMLHEIRYLFRLLFYVERMEWKILWKTRRREA